jgi:hypothetical protein
VRGFWYPDFCSKMLESNWMRASEFLGRLVSSFNLSSLQSLNGHSNLVLNFMMLLICFDLQSKVVFQIRLCFDCLIHFSNLSPGHFFSSIPLDFAAFAMHSQD